MTQHERELSNLSYTNNGTGVDAFSGVMAYSILKIGANKYGKLKLISALKSKGIKEINYLIINQIISIVICGVLIALNIFVSSTFYNKHFTSCIPFSIIFVCKLFTKI